MRVDNSFKHNFEKLSPVRNINIKIHEEALNEAFNDDDISNIAISGAYGSGKSSIIESYKLKHPKLCFMQVSLAHFNENKENLINREEGTNTGNLNSIEGKIINQLFQQVAPKRIPQTSFKVKRKSNKLKLGCFSVLFIFMVLLIFYIYFKEDIVSTFNATTPKYMKAIGSFLNKNEIMIIASSIIVIIISLFFFKFVKIIHGNLAIHRLKLFNSELEIFAEKDNTIFDTAINEIVYLIQQSGADAIIFEDIDRYNSVSVLERIREINLILNNNKDTKKKVKFIYLIKDELFTAKDRVKFFELIIPVVPVVDSSNSYDKIIELLESDDKFRDKLSTSFLKEISLYIDDYRMIKNILNEFKIYFDAINLTELDYNKLFAIMTYKSLFPKDFSQLQSRKGYIYTLFQHKDKLLNPDNIESIGKPLHQLLTRDNIDKYFNEINEVNYKNEIVNDFAEIKSNEYYMLLKYLVRYGYIDESYQSYMTYFYGKSIHDKDFELSITNQKKKPYSYKLGNPKSLIQSIPNYRFTQEEILNFDLFNELINEYLTDTEVDNKLNSVIEQLKNAVNVAFITEYIQNNYDGIKLMKLLNNKWQSFFWKLLHKSDDIPDDIIKQFSTLILYTASENELQNINIENCLTDYISSKEDYLNIIPPSADLILHSFAALNVSFKKINAALSNKDLLNIVYTHSMYDITFSNIQTMLHEFWNIDDDEKVKHSNFTLISADKNSPLYKYITNNKQVYINEVTNNCEGMIDDNDSAICEILNSTDLTPDSITEYIHALKPYLISDITKIKSKSLWDLLLEEKVISCNENNILSYYCHNTSPELLIKYTNSSSVNSLDFATFTSSENESKLRELSKIFILDTELPESKYIEINAAFPEYDDYNFSELQEERAKLLVNKLHRIPMSKRNLDSIRENYSRDFLVNYISLYFETFIQLGEICKKDIILILQENCFNLEQKSNALDCTGKYPIEIVGKGYPSELLSKILKNNMSDADLPDFFENYHYYPRDAQIYIAQKARDLLIAGSFVNNYNTISIHLINYLINDSSIAEILRIRFFKEISNGLSKEFIINYLCYFETNFKDYFNGHRKQFSNNEKNQLLLEIAKDNGLITSFNETKDRKRFSVKSK